MHYPSFFDEFLIWLGLALALAVLSGKGPFQSMLFLVGETILVSVILHKNGFTFAPIFLLLLFLSCHILMCKLSYMIDNPAIIPKRKVQFFRVIPSVILLTAAYTLYTKLQIGTGQIMGKESFLITLSKTRYGTLFMLLPFFSFCFVVCTVLILRHQAQAPKASKKDT